MLLLIATIVTVVLIVILLLVFPLKDSQVSQENTEFDIRIWRKFLSSMNGYDFMNLFCFEVFYIFITLKVNEVSSLML